MVKEQPYSGNPHSSGTVQPSAPPAPHNQLNESAPMATLVYVHPQSKAHQRPSPTNPSSSSLMAGASGKASNREDESSSSSSGWIAKVSDISKDRLQSYSQIFNLNKPDRNIQRAHYQQQQHVTQQQMTSATPLTPNGYDNPSSNGNVNHQFNYSDPPYKNNNNQSMNINMDSPPPINMNVNPSSVTFMSSTPSHIPPPPTREWMIDSNGNETMCSAVNPILVALPCFWLHMFMLLPCLCFSGNISQYDVIERSGYYTAKQMKLKEAEIRDKHPNMIECKGKDYLFNPEMPMAVQQHMSQYGLDGQLFSTIVNEIKQELVMNIKIGQRTFSLAHPHTMQYRKQKLEYVKQLLIHKYSQIGITLTFMDQKLLYITVNGQVNYGQYNATLLQNPSSPTLQYNHQNNNNNMNVNMNADIAPPPYTG